MVGKVIGINLSYWITLVNSNLIPNSPTAGYFIFKTSDVISFHFLPCISTRSIMSHSPCTQSLSSSSYLSRVVLLSIILFLLLAISLFLSISICSSPFLLFISSLSFSSQLSIQSCSYFFILSFYKSISLCLACLVLFYVFLSIIIYLLLLLVVIVVAVIFVSLFRP